MHDRTGLIGSLQREIRRVLRPLLTGAARIALIDFPNHTNVGDSAIWLGQLRALAELGIARPVYTSDDRTYDRGLLRRALGDGIILISGGGTTGDLWERHQHFHERVIADFPDNPIVLMPRSIHFARQDSLERARRAFAAHPDLTLLARDVDSLAFARRQFDCRSLPCPDMAFALGPLPRATEPTMPVLWLGREDVETLPSSRMPTGTMVPCVDWLGEEPTMLSAFSWRLTRRLADGDHARPLMHRVLASTYAPLARRRLERGCLVLSQGEMVVTDRLHGHILCVLLGIPHLLLDNNHGKLTSFHRTWTMEGSGARQVQSAAEAIEMLPGAGCA